MPKVNLSACHSRHRSKEGKRFAQTPLSYTAFFAPYFNIRFDGTSRKKFPPHSLSFSLHRVLLLGTFTAAATTPHIPIKNLT
jgi:hypothetical protein